MAHQNAIGCLHINLIKQCNGIATKARSRGHLFVNGMQKRMPMIAICNMEGVYFGKKARV